MKRAMRIGILSVWFTVLVSAVPLASAQAGILSWGCFGQAGEQVVAFNRDGLYVASRKEPLPKVRKLSVDAIEKVVTDIKNGSDAAHSYIVDNDDGLAGPLSYSRVDDVKKKLVLTRQSSKAISCKNRLICGRDESTDLSRNVYRLVRDGEPPLDITMQCFEYQLSTRGGRKGCD
jgi:hypothetical protein